MTSFDDINKKLGLQPLTPAEMNKIHFESGEHTEMQAQSVNLKNLKNQSPQQ